MKTLRPFFYLLLAANIMLATLSALPLLGFQLPWAPTGEADRLTRQLSPGSIQLIAPTPVKESIGSATEIPPETNPNAISCIALRNLNLEATQKISEQAARQGDGLAVRLIGVSPTSYWVNIPPGGGKDGATKRAEVLAKAGVEDYIIVRDSGPTQFSISLGLFRSEEAANRLIEQLKKKNIKSARVTVRDNTGNNARAEISGRNEFLEPLITDFLTTHADAQRDVCSNAS